MTCSSRIIMIASFICLAVAGVIYAQLEKLDKGTLYDGLAKEGMTELLLHLMDSEPPGDPVIACLIRVAQYRTRYSDEQLSTQLRNHAYQTLLVELRKLIHDYYDHEQRPLWQTDLAVLLLFEQLGTQSQDAALFYEFGLPDVTQRQLFEETVPEALAELADANLQFFRLASLLPRQVDHVEKRVNTGLWQRMIDQYWKSQTQYYLAQAAYYTALLPNDHPYFANLGNHPKIVEQKETVENERKRLLTLAIRSIGIFLNKEAPTYNEQLHRHSLLLRGRTLVAQDKLDDAMSDFESVISTQGSDITDLVAHMAKAELLDQRGKTKMALSILNRLAQHHLAQNYLLYRLLVTDQMHRIRLRAAQESPPSKRVKAIAAAYEPYVELFSDPSLGREVIDLRNFVYQRWEQNLPVKADLTQLPPIVVVGMAQFARADGQNKAIESEEAASQGLEAVAKTKLTDAKLRLERAIKLTTPLLDRRDLPDAIRGQAMYNWGLATYYSATSDPTAALRASQMWIDMAEQLSDQPDAERAIEYAEGVLRLWRGQPQASPQLRKAYERATSVLFTTFPASNAADDARLYYGVYVLEPAGRFDEAVDMFAHVPYGHVNYFEAQGEMIFCLAQSYQSPSQLHKDRTEEYLLSQTRRLMRDAENARDQANNAQLVKIDAAIIASQLALADIANAKGNYDKALKLLAAIDLNQPTSDPVLGQRIIDALAKRITILVETNRVDQAVEQAAQMMQATPGDAAKVVGQVLDRLQSQIDVLRQQASKVIVENQKRALLDRAREKAHMTSKLASLLNEWADGQAMNETQILPYRLIHAKALRLAGQPRQSLDILEPLASDSFANNADILHNLAEAYFMLGGTEPNEQILQHAASYYVRLIQGLTPGPSGKYPDHWWNAWMRRLQIMDQLNKHTDDISLLVRQLESLTDPNLGDQPYKAELIRLKVKHQ